MRSLLQLLRDLVAIPSINPSLVPGATGERDIADAIGTELRAAGLDVEFQEGCPGRPNVVGVLEGIAPGPSLMFCGHTDTVGVEGMDAPFDPVLRDGRLYGRGAQDMKGGLAAMIDAARRLAAAGFARGRLIVACVADEEYASAGADALVTKWRADAAIVTEPTSLAIGIAHKGFSAAEVRVHGVAAHGSRPAEGRDAILRMGRVLARLEALDRSLQRGPRDPWLGPASLHASTIRGGGELSSYPASCVLQLERRTIPGETVDVSVREAQGILDALLAEDAEFSAEVSLLLARPPYAIDPSHALVAELDAACRTRDVDTRSCGLSFWTDAAILGGAGIPTVLFGPGGAGLHSTSEYVHVADVDACSDVLVDVAHRWCGRA
jgi:acetylornithine deacetylase